MKSTFSICTILLFSSFCRAQTMQLKLQPINVDIRGRYITGEFRKIHNNHVWNAGLGYLINPFYKDRFYNAVYVNKAYASNLLEHMTINFGYERSFKIKKGSVRIFPFFEFSVAYTGIKYEAYSLVRKDKYGYIVQAYNGVYPDDKILWIINHTGLGCEFPLTSRISLNQQVGFSPALITSYNKRRSETVIEPGIEDPFYGIGINYVLK